MSADPGTCQMCHLPDESGTGICNDCWFTHFAVNRKPIAAPVKED